MGVQSRSVKIEAATGLAKELGAHGNRTVSAPVARGTYHSFSAGGTPAEIAHWIWIDHHPAVALAE